MPRRRSIASFGAAYARWRPTRSVLSAALIAFACFVIVAVGAFRRDPSDASVDARVGHGRLRADGRIGGAADAQPEHRHRDARSSASPATPSWTRRTSRDSACGPGDEASCLTLYQPKNPRHRRARSIVPDRDRDSRLRNRSPSPTKNAPIRGCCSTARSTMARYRRSPIRRR